ncbi:GNAT family N-acetyltransferase [Neobacillus piezotolerans]|uniref:GNAT family N-acetyltransferase n=1 Tax=Neobacillus piezotolerans TaxID=2259171 RepID=A0A3D8GQL5_9BACI|nr:GNAT family N-acetyltransferase [Neobacillus piezotolerans]RDU36785.1 GNAT family N-acetyltransferase [Neobacillus piezotolerans]
MEGYEELVMEKVSRIRGLFKREFKILEGLPISIVLEQIEPGTVPDWEEKVSELIEISGELGVERVGVTLHKGNPEAEMLGNLLLEKGFEHFSSKVDVIKDLNKHEKPDEKLMWRSLESPELTEEEFKDYWEQAMRFSANQASSLSMDQQLASVKAELGAEWKGACRVFYIEGKAVGVGIPHIEPGMPGEGRLFYFGILPEARGRGLGAFLHKNALSMLKAIGADYYVGSTHLANVAMQRVFERNGCSVRSYTESYYFYFK